MRYASQVGTRFSPFPFLLVWEKLFDFPRFPQESAGHSIGRHAGPLDALLTQ
jgi:hypothetical protein